MKNRNVQLVIIDPQNDFHDRPGAALPVPGSMADAGRIAALIERNARALSDIHVTLDTHQQLDIAHPMMWVDSQGRSPAPFTQITADDVRNGSWRAANPGWQPRMAAYVEQLEANGRYPLTIWPPHTLVGSEGHNIVAPVLGALNGWEQQRRRRFAVLAKGHNPWTEHYSAVQADVPDPGDPTTQLNTDFIRTLEQADLVLFSGQALSHCVANTVRDVVGNFGADAIRKLVFIEDTSSPVPGFEALADDFLRDMKARGMQTARAAEVNL